MFNVWCENHPIISALHTFWHLKVVSLNLVAEIDATSWWRHSKRRCTVDPHHLQLPKQNKQKYSLSFWSNTTSTGTGITGGGVLSSKKFFLWIVVLLMKNHSWDTCETVLNYSTCDTFTFEINVCNICDFCLWNLLNVLYFIIDLI